MWLLNASKYAYLMHHPIDKRMFHLLLKVL